MTNGWLLNNGRTNHMNTHTKRKGCDLGGGGRAYELPRGRQRPPLKGREWRGNC